jgi:hypothetical protein
MLRHSVHVQAVTMMRIVVETNNRVISLLQCGLNAVRTNLLRTISGAPNWLQPHPQSLD